MNKIIAMFILLLPFCSFSKNNSLSVNLMNLEISKVNVLPECYTLMGGEILVNHDEDSIVFAIPIVDGVWKCSAIRKESKRLKNQLINLRQECESGLVDLKSDTGDSEADISSINFECIQ